MTLTRIYFDGVLTENSEITLPPVASKHLVQVLRLKVDSKFIIFNGEAKEYQATISEVNKKFTKARIGDATIVNSESPLAIHLAQCVSRGERMDFTIQKSVELGVRTITPIFSEFCQVKLSTERLAKRLQHWQAIATHAAEQSGRTKVPEILSAIKLSEWLDVTSGLKIITEPRAELSLCTFMQQQQHLESVHLLVGSEGGFSDAEIKLIDTYKDCYLVNLGPRVMRTESAAMVAMALLQSYHGDLN